MIQRVAGVKRLFLAILTITVLGISSAARADDAGVQTAWRLLDYIAVDYPGAVADGRIVSQLEYDEMKEFSGSVSRRIAALPAHAERPRLVEEARALEAAVAARAAPTDIARRARGLGAALLAAYPVPLAPDSVPDLARGGLLYAQNCASCHGAAGAADTEAGRALDPPAIAFTDRDRARQRSLFALFQVIGQGLEGTGMQSYAHLSGDDRWALAFYVGRFAYPEALAERGAALWRGDPALRDRIPDMATLAGLTPEVLAGQIGEENAAAVTAHLRSNPGTLMRAGGAQSLEIARNLLGQSLEAYRRGDRALAGELALSAYLDGFEPIEALLNARDGGLVAEAERAMGQLRAAIGRGAPVPEVTERASQLQALFDRAETALAPEAGSHASTFLGALAILLREGLEALLIVVAMIGFLRKAERPELLRYVHWGWASALALGVATWWAASHVIAISGADRELTEGFGSLIAAAILLFVGIWMHGKAQAGAWQAYVRDKLDKALSGNSVWFLFGLSFIAVYREVFETIIFFAALGGEGNGVALVAGIALALALLALTAWAMLKLSRALPIGKFFAYSAALIAVLAVVLAGKGFAALQEAGLIGVTPLESFPRSVVLGVYPTLETILAQGVMALLLAGGFLYTRRKPAQAA
jgi:high-affinity iron transporter